MQPPLLLSPVSHTSSDAPQEAKEIAMPNVVTAVALEAIEAKEEVVLSPEEQINAYTKEVLDPVIKVAAGIMQNIALLFTVTEEQVKAVSEYKVKVSGEELALYNHFSQMILQQCSQIVAVLPGQCKMPFAMLIQTPLQQKMPEAVKKIKSISPEFLINVQLVAYKPKLDELIKNMQDVDPKALKVCKEHLAAATRGEESLQPIREVYELVDNVAAQIKADIAKYLTKGIDRILEEKERVCE